jgi:hypothetical protein
MPFCGAQLNKINNLKENNLKRIATLTYQHLTIAALLVSLTLTVACTPQHKLAVVTDIEKFIPAITNVADAVCAFTPAAPICAAGVTAVSASAKILDAALVNYFTAEANGTVPPGIVSALQQAVTTFESDAGNILDAVHVVDAAHQLEIEAIAASASVLLGVVESLLPSTVTANKFKVQAASAKSFNLSAWTVDYNGKVAYCQKHLPRSVTLKSVHVHSAIARYGTLGLLK